MNNPAFSPIPLVVELHEDFAFLLENDGASRLLRKIEDSLGGLLIDLGILGELQIMLIANSPFKPFRLRLHEELVSYPPALFGQVWEYFAIEAPGKLAAGYNPEAWLKENFPAPENPVSPKPALAAGAAERLEDFFALLIGEILRLQPEKLAGRGQFKDFIESGRRILPDSLCKQLDQLGPERMGSILKSLLEMRISLGERETILSEACRLLEDGQEDAEIAEALIARLRPQKLDVEIHPAYLEQLLGHLPPEHAVAVWGEEADPKIRDIFTLFSDGLFYELGIRFPGIRLVKNENLAKNAFAIRLNHLLTLPRRGLRPDQILVNEAPAYLANFGVSGTTPIINPANKRENSLAALSQREALESAGITTWDALGYLVLALASEIRRQPGCLVDAESAEYELALLDEAYPEIVSAALESFSCGQLAAVFRRLLSEGISVRDLRGILERLLHYDYILTDPSRYIVFDDRLAIHQDIGHGEHPTAENLAQFVRSGLKDYISHKYTYGRGQSTLNVYLLDTALESRVVEHLAAKSGKEEKRYLTEEEIETIRGKVRNELSSLSPDAVIPAILTAASVRPFMRDLLAIEFPDLPALSYDELSATTNITLIAKIYLE